jgi:hypothetical protein
MCRRRVSIFWMRCVLWHVSYRLLATGTSRLLATGTSRLHHPRDVSVTERIRAGDELVALRAKICPLHHRHIIHRNFDP